MSTDSAWCTFDAAIPERGRAFLILRRGAWREPRFVVGAELGLPMRVCSAWLGMWRCKGRVKVVGKVNTGRRLSNLYEVASR